MTGMTSRPLEMHGHMCRGGPTAPVSCVSHAPGSAPAHRRRRVANPYKSLGDLGPGGSIGTRGLGAQQGTRGYPKRPPLAGWLRATAAHMQPHFCGSDPIHLPESEIALAKRRRRLPAGTGRSERYRCRTGPRRCREASIQACPTPRPDWPATQRARGRVRTNDSRTRGPYSPRESTWKVPEPLTKKELRGYVSDCNIPLSEANY